jgi:hypothetical protein
MREVYFAYFILKLPPNYLFRGAVRDADFHILTDLQIIIDIIKQAGEPHPTATNC